MTCSATDLNPNIRKGHFMTTRSVGDGFRELDERIDYFIKFNPVQNFGDYLPELICKEFFTYPRIDADVFRLIGSVIDDRWARKDLRRVNGHLSGLIAYWCCGARDARGLSDEVAAHCRFFGVRGPLTRDVLGLPADTVLGDPGLLAPLFHTPRSGAATAGKVVCIPHIQDPKSPDELKLMSGCDMLIHPEIPASEEALRTILDQIAAADFVLTASLHGAIIACAYGRPFAFWDNGHIDVPFKWEDFAGSVGLPLNFVRTQAEGRQFYEEVARHRLVIPPLTPILESAPFVVRPSATLKALAHDGEGDDDAFAAAIAVLDRLPSASLDEVHNQQRDSAVIRSVRGRGSKQLQTLAWRALWNGKRRIQAMLTR